MDAGGAAHLADGVHTELRAADVYRLHAQLGGHDRPNGRAARRVIPHHKILKQTTES